MRREIKIANKMFMDSKWADMDNYWSHKPEDMVLKAGSMSMWKMSA